MVRILPSLAFGLSLALSVAPATAAERMTVLLDWFVNPDHAPLVVAKAAGIFERHGLDVALVAPADPTQPPRLVAAGQAEIAVHYQPNLTLDIAAGLPLSRIGTLVETPLNTLMTLKGGPIGSLADLKGKRIGFSVSGFEDALLARMLAGVDLTTADVELVNINFALSASLISGQVDAVIGAFRNFEQTQLRIEGHEGVAYFPEEHGVPAYEELIIVTNTALLDDPRMPAFLEAIEEATIFLTNHPDEAWEIFIKAYPDLDDELNRTAWKDTLPRFAKRPAAFDAGRYERFAVFLQESGLIDEALPASSYGVALR
jgi:putative hydroxymethylpyrimidine transport system substrate-binding protein